MQTTTSETATLERGPRDGEQRPVTPDADKITFGNHSAEGQSILDHYVRSLNTTDDGSPVFGYAGREVIVTPAARPLLTRVLAHLSGNTPELISL